MKINGAQLTIQLLEAQGVRFIAGIPGGTVLPLYDALSQSRQIRHVLARHEQAAGFIAQGVARITGEAGVCLATSGPGATNLVTAIADANLDSVPLVAITGQVPRAMIGTDAFQEVDAYGLAIPITKHNFLVSSARELAEVIPRAFEIARAGRPGPVWIDIPKDVQTESIEPRSLVARQSESREDGVDRRAIAACAERINTAARPVLLLGGGVVQSDAAQLAVRLAETASLPVAMTLMGLGAMAPDHRLYLGMLGMHGARYTNLVMDEADLVIAVGARFDDRATGDPGAFCPNARIIHIDIDAAELGKIKHAHVAVAGHAARVLAALLPLIEPRRRRAWGTRVCSLKREHPLDLAAATDPRSHYGLIRAVADCLDGTEVVTTDVGQHQMWVAQTYPLRRPRQWLTSGGLGTMGFGLPAAIGASLAAPERTVVCFTGDGSLLMNLQELATAAEEAANVKIVLINNHGLGLVHQQQELFYGNRIFACRYRQPADFMALARGFGIAALNLDSTADPGHALRCALQRQGPCLIHASVAAGEKVFPMVPPGAANRDMIGEAR